MIEIKNGTFERFLGGFPRGKPSLWVPGIEGSSWRVVQNNTCCFMLFGPSEMFFDIPEYSLCDVFMLFWGINVM